MGILHIKRRDPQQASIYRSWLNDHVLKAFSDRILSFDTNAALKCAQLYIPNLKPERDIMIGATNMVHGFSLVTRNVKDFRHIDVKLVDPWGVS